MSVSTGISGCFGITHLTTVHRRDDVRILFKESATLSGHFHDIALFVYDGQGNSNVAGVNIFDLGNPPPNRLLRMVTGAIRVFRSPEVAKSKIVHFHDPELLIVGLVLKWRGKAVIYDAHEDVPRQIANKHWIPMSLRSTVARLVEFVENFVVQRLDAVVAATPLIAERFGHFNALTTIVRNYPLLDEFLQIPLEKPVSRDVCYVGALTRERGILQLLDVLVLLGDVKLVACGPFQSAEFEAELRQHPGWQYVEYLGVVGREQVASVLARSQVGLVTLLPTPNQIEALPVKMFEYMASGTPFLASDFPLWAEIAVDSGGGVCVDPSTPEGIASTLAEMLGNPKVLKAMGSAGRKAAIERYNWSSEAEHLIGLYQRLLPSANA